jgi:acyl-CoA thioesterase I
MSARRPLLLLPLLAALAALSPAAAAAPGEDAVCGAPAEFLDGGLALPATARAVEAGRLRILVGGSASVFGPGTSGPGAAWPARLEALLATWRPGLAIEMVVRGGRGLTAAESGALIEAELAPAPAQLVLWQTGTVEAARGLEPEALTEALTSGLERLEGARADVVLIDPQFSRFLRANANVEPYLDAIRLVGAAHGVPVLRRYELMRFWAETDRVDLERAPRGARTAMADRLNLCLAEALAALIRQGVKEARGRPTARP